MTAALKRPWLPVSPSCSSNGSSPHADPTASTKRAHHLKSPPRRQDSLIKSPESSLIPTPPSSDPVGPADRPHPAVAVAVSEKPLNGQKLVVPGYYNDADIEILTFLIADILDRLTTHNDHIPLHPTNITRFHSRRPAPITILDYLRRIVHHTRLDKSCLLAILIYMDRVCTAQTRFTVSSLTVHRFLITAVTVASKAHLDVFFSNRVYAEVGGVGLGELNRMEMELVRMVEWEVLVTGERLQEYYVRMVGRHPNLTFEEDLF
ncbi:hypothetical protein HDU67_000682 [Dinochytrium kinnereticum]|nr:hypothetical protein HDU67_000682 [Dinochytrium kinnereticum]